jgi:glycerol-3-phosphate dehydrogenase subunit C
MGPKAAEMLKLIPETPVDVIERCSGHGGTFGVVKPTHDVAVKVGRPVFRAANAKPRGHIVSDCPLAAEHIVANTDTGVTEPEHPIQIMARAFGLAKD